MGMTKLCRLIVCLLILLQGGERKEKAFLVFLSRLLFFFLSEFRSGYLCTCVVCTVSTVHA
jgi:hypothetical protein